MKKIIFATVSLLALATVIAWQPAGLNHQTGIACGGCTNSVTTLACGGCSNSVSSDFACGGCTNGVTLALAGF